MTRPHPMGDTRRHLLLIQGMAARTGADTVRAFDEGRLTNEGWADAITRCRNCGWAEGCKAWLADTTSEPRAVPDTCANADLMRGLIPGE